MTTDNIMFSSTLCPTHRTGGELLVTNMRRGETLFDVDPDVKVGVFNPL